MKVYRVEKDDWYREHAGSFEEIFDYGQEEFHVFDFVLVVFSDDNIRIGFISCNELDGESVYLNYGGMFMNAQGKKLASDAFSLCLGYLSEKYKRVGFLTKTVNKKMITLGYKMGFEIIGMRMAHGVPNVEMLMEFGG